MKQLRYGLSLILFGNLLYLLYILLSSTKSSSFGDFSNGFLLGLSIGINLIGIIIVAIYMSKSKNNKIDK